MQLSLIVPVYNRPDEVEELLASLLTQQQQDYEVLLVEDGSTQPSREVARAYDNRLPLRYFEKPNSGPGLSRNYGAQRAQGQYYIFLDSDCVLPPGYLAAVAQFLEKYPQTDVFGGPDRARADFSPIQKAINYSMTSFLTTGGIRGGKRQMEKFHPRSFNMGLSRRAFEVTGGFSAMRFGEDIDLSIRLRRAHFSTALIPGAFVYHKRRSTFRQFFKQIFNSGVARVNLQLKHPGTLRLVHLFPFAFALGWTLALLGLLAGWPWLAGAYLLYLLAILAHSTLLSWSLRLGMLSVLSSFIQLTAYGWGFAYAAWKRWILGRGAFASFERTFYD
ncbi:MAG: glycosyltransferase [Schleiferiaceae bacterium]|nr:glycosyltransferase [Schleiferiaceae bacterium]MDR9442378.1 glycosyltransferase [Schleiferiaceae bacterium]